ncbi:anti-sigma-28 factor, FlgM family [Kushneria avicenniae]|uniref:Negative regulator of flagellin synthesis n=1 Tax=Kushneria avicenniae TaxID=402385 RepID=A0A1I1F7Y0_9GAMM|nr:flagellar biosynthesis anti-sigma factor FlgM [Kushneria avicenniae]SFB95401.1 anti-sigma-28 factor, FlgM family [Kushneria avicenniae]
MKIDSNNSINRIASPVSVPRASTPETAKNEQSAATRWVPSSAHDGSKDIDTVRVNELRQAIRDGSFEVDTGKIADGLIASAQELLSNKG